MRSLEEFWDWVRGTRARPPPGPSRPLATAFFYVGAFAHLPLVYALVATSALPPIAAIAVGALAMGLAWAGGVSLEGRRPGTSRALAAAGLLEGALALVPTVQGELGAARWAFLAVSLLSAGALAALLRPARHQGSA